MNSQEREDLISQLYGAIYTTIDGDDVEYEGIYREQGEEAATKFNKDIVDIVHKDYPDIVEDDDGLIIPKEEFHSECFFHETTFENLSDTTLLELKKYMTEADHM